MAAAPEGTITLLFTDIEGSTQLLRRAGSEEYSQLLSAHHRLVREAFAAHAGYEVDTQGDSFFAVFRTASDAVEAALAAQQAIAAHAWPDDWEIRVRMGIHTGSPDLHGNHYIGLDVHHASRVMGAAHGGQTVITRTTKELLPADVVTRDLGEHLLKDLSGRQRLFQLGDREFPPLKTLHRSNLPVPTTPFLGRSTELTELASLIDGARLVTLTGAGGTGKTRLALQAAAAAADAYPDGVWFVALASATHADAIRPAIALAVGLPEETLDSALRTLRALLVLDNVEQVEEAPVAVAELVTCAPQASFLVTSRGRLGLLGEQEYPVPTLTQGEAVELFVARARRLRPSFEADSAVGAICARLDGMPLAVELAAGRTKALTPAQILDRLGTALDLLTSRAPDVPERQRTLRATIGWSYSLVAPGEAELFARLGGFAGGFDTDAAEQVARATIDDLEQLVDRNLVRMSADGRFFLYETLRAFAREQLDNAGALDAIARAHAVYFRDLALRAEPEFEGRRQVEWFDRLDEERDNVRSALDWSAVHDPAVALGIVGALWLYWSVRGPLLESIQHCERALAASEADDGLAFPQAMLAASYLSNRAGRSEWACELARDALARYRAAGDMRGAGRALRDEANALSSLERWDDARRALEESAVLSRRAEDSWNLAIVLNNLGYVARGIGELERALAYADESAELRRSIGDWRGLVLTLQNRAFVEVELGLLDRAERGSIESAELADRLGYREGLTGAILLLGAIGVFRGRPEDGVLLMGAGLQGDEESGLVVDEAERRVFDAALTSARASLGDAEFERQLGQGRALPLDVAVARAMASSV